MENGTRFTLAFWQEMNEGAAVGVEHRVKCDDGSTVVEEFRVVRVLPDAAAARTWVTEWNRLEAERILANALVPQAE